MDKSLFNGTFVVGFKEEMKKLEGKLDEVYSKLNKIVYNEDYLGGDSYYDKLKALFGANIRLEDFLGYTLNLYTEFLEEMGLSISELEAEVPLENDNDDMTLDAYLTQCLMLSQNDQRWKELAYKYKGYPISGNGCGPSSLTNLLIAAFGITDPNVVAGLYKEVASLSENYGLSWMNGYFLDPNNKKYRKYAELNNLVNGHHSKFVPISKKNDNEFITKYNFEQGTPVFMFGRYSFSQKKHQNTDAWNNENVRNLVNNLYNQGVNADLYFGGVAVGTENLKFPFRGGAGGHYVTVAINTNEFCEQGTIYLIDSYPKNLEGEDEFKKKYAFVEKPGIFRQFNETYNVERRSDNVLKIQLQDGASFNEQNMGLLGLTSGSTIVLVYDDTGEINTETTSSNVDYSSLDQQISDYLPKATNIASSTETQ